MLHSLSECVVVGEIRIRVRIYVTKFCNRDVPPRWRQFFSYFVASVENNAVLIFCIFPFFRGIAVLSMVPVHHVSRDHFLSHSGQWHRNRIGELFP